jgi:peptidyl-prolyl cis-trans isomerase C
MGRRFCSVVAVALFAVAGCKGKEPGATAQSGTEAQVEAKVLAKVGERTITVGDFLEALSNLDEIDRARFSSPARRKELLDALIETEALAQEALAQGLDKEPAVAQELRMGLRDAMLREIHRAVPKPEAIDAAEVKAYYDAHLASYAEPERRRLQAIVVATEAEAKRVAATLGPEPSAQRFGEVVKAKSIDVSAKSSAPVDLLGDVGFVGAPGDDRGSSARVPAEVRAAAAALKGVGSVSEPVKAGSSFWVVRVTSLSAARARTFDEVEKTIRVALAQDKRVAAEKAKLLALAAEAKIVLDDKALDAVFREAAVVRDGGATP